MTSPAAPSITAALGLLGSRHNALKNRVSHLEGQTKVVLVLAGYTAATQTATLAAVLFLALR